MHFLAKVSRVSLVVVGGVALAACSSGTRAEDSAPSQDALSAANIELPSGDPCRDVLGSLALGLAEGSVGRDNTNAVRVTVVGQDEWLHYEVLVDGKTFSANGQSFANDYRWSVALDNDYTAQCYLVAAKLLRDGDAGHPLQGEKRATAKELAPSDAPVDVSPANDACASPLKYLARGAAVSAVGASNIVSTKVALDGESDTRSYTVHVDGKSFTQDGHNVANDHDFIFELDNDSASTCLPLSLTAKQ